MKQLHLEQNTPEWLEARKMYRTASEAAIVLGLSPFQTPASFKAIKLGLKKQYYSKAMQLGHDLEDQVRQHASEHLDKYFEPECWVNGNYLASLDGIDGDTLVEIKVSDHTYNDLVAGTLPDYYEAQVQQQLYCSPAEVGYIYAYSPKQDKYAISTAITADPAFLPKLEAAWEAFDAMELPDDAPVDLSDDGAALALFNQYEMLQAQATRAKDQLAEVKERLLELAKGRPVVAGDYSITMRNGSKRVDYKAAATAAKLDLSDYTTQGEPTYVVKVPKNPFA